MEIVEQYELVDEKDKIKPVNEQNIACNKNTKRSSYPWCILFIIGMEFCERFSYYGMRTILVLYARDYLRFDDDTSTAIFHAFTLFAYLTPLFGAILADSHLGKYKAIAYLSIVYTMGHVFKTIGTIPYIPSATAHLVLSMLGLFLIAVGTGGIKPCVSSFGGDQFKPDQIEYRSQYFSYFYLAINSGALISKFITPMLRADLNCYPGHKEPQFKQCFSVAFGVPGLLMVVALVLFLIGTSYYTVVKPEGSIFWRFCKCVYSAFKNRWFRPHNINTKQHWIEYADASKELKRDSIVVLRVLFLFLPLPFFWALFDQQGSRWTLQALHLDGYWGNYRVKPEQIDVVNPLFIVLFIPLFESTLYPLLRYCKINFSPLRRMTTGLVLAGLSFVCAAILQFQIDKRLTNLPDSNQISLRIINPTRCSINLNSSISQFNGLKLKPNEVFNRQQDFLPGNTYMNFSYRSCDSTLVKFEILNRSGNVVDVILSGNFVNKTILSNMPTKKLENGNATVSFLFVDYVSQNVTVETREISPGIRSKYKEISKGKTNYTVYLHKHGMERKAIYNGTIDAGPGGGYSIFFRRIPFYKEKIEAINFNNNSYQLLDFNPNTINIAWMIPQYFIITVGEVFLSVTGLEFSYTQAPKSMKSVLTSFWLLTVSMGNVIVLLIAKTKPISRQAYEFLLFAILIGIAAIIFGIMAKSYVYVKENEFETAKTETLKENEDEPLVNNM